MENNAVNTIASSLQNGTAAAPANEPQTLADVIGVSESPAEQQPTPETTPAQPQQEPGWFKGRMEKERAKWDAERQAETARMEERQNALLERIIARDAQDLVDSGEFKSLERATEYLRMKEGLPINQQPSQNVAQHPRDEQGRFVSPQAQQLSPEYAEAHQRAGELVKQADALHRATGVDVMAIYNTNPQAREMILGGKDFVDVLQTFGSQPKQHVPSPIRSSNGVSVGNVSIAKMSDQEFAKLNALLAKNGKVDMR